MHPVLEALQTLGNDDQLAPTVAVTLDDGEQPLAQLFEEAGPLLDMDGLRPVLLRTLSLLIQRRRAAEITVPRSAGDTDTTLFQAYKHGVAWPVLGRSSARGTCHCEVCVCLHELAERAGEQCVRELQNESVRSIDALVQRLGIGIETESRVDELCALGACELGSVLCKNGAWQHGFGRRLVPPLLRLLPLESAAAIGLHGVADAMEADSSADGPNTEEGGRHDDEPSNDEDAEGSTVQSIALTAILRQIVDQATDGDLVFVADALRKSVCELLPPVRGESIHRYSSGGNQALGLSIGCSFHELLFADGACATCGLEDIRNSPEFWSMLRGCLLDPRTEVRSLALDLLRHAVADSITSDMDNIEEGLDWAASPMRAAWSVFCMLYETLQQFAVHLLEGVWPQIARIFDASPDGWARGPKSSHPRLPVNDWAAVLFQRGMMSENHAVQRLVVFSTLQGDVYDHQHSRVTDEVVFSGILTTCRGMWLYKQVTDDDQEAEVAPLLREFLSQHLASVTSVHGASAGKALLHKLAKHLHCVPDTVTSRARMTLIGAMDHLRVPHMANVRLLGDDCLRELRGIVVDQVPLEHSEAARDSILLACLSMACRFGSLPPSQSDDQISFSAVARLLLHYRVNLISIGPAMELVASLSTSLGANWLGNGLKALVSEYLLPTGQRSAETVKALPSMLTFAAHLGDEAGMILYESTLKPAVEAVASAFTHMYAPVGQAKAAIELLDAVMQQNRAPLLNECLAKLIGNECEGIAGYLGACLDSKFDVLAHGAMTDLAQQQRLATSATAMLCAHFLVHCSSLLTSVDEYAAGRFEATMQAVALRAAQLVKAKKDYVSVQGGIERNCAKIDALNALTTLAPFVQVGTESEVACLLTALLGIELEAQTEQHAQTDAYESNSYGSTWSERRNMFSRSKWDCVCALIQQIEGGSRPKTIRFPTGSSTNGLAKALVDAVESSTDALDILSPAEGAAAASNMLLPIFEMLRHVLPWYLAQGGEEISWAERHTRLDRILEPAWTAFDEVMKKTLPFLLTAITLFLPSSLWGDKRWHNAAGDTGQPGPLKRMYARLAVMGGSNRSTRVMSILSLHCCRLWTIHPQISALYIDEIVAICCYSNAHDESSKAHQHSGAVLRIGTEHSPPCAVEYPTVFGLRKCQEMARLSARLFFEYLCKRAEDSHTTENVHYDLSVSFLQQLLATNQKQEFANTSYAPGGDIWKLKIVLWQGIGVLVGCVRPGTEFAIDVHNSLAAMMKRNEAPTIRQQADAAFVKLFLRCPDLLEKPGWLPDTIVNFKSPPQVAMSLMVIVGALLPRLTPQLRSRLFFRLFNPMVTWINAGNRALRALSLVVVERLLSLAEQAQNQNSNASCDGWPDLQHNVYYRALHKYFHGSPEGRAFTLKLGPYLDVFNPEELCSPHTLNNQSVDISSEQGSPAVDDTTPHIVRQFPISVYELIKDSFKGMVMMVCEDEAPPVAKTDQASSAMEQLVAGSGSQVPWTPGALDPPLPDYVVRYQQRCLSAEAADTMPEPEEQTIADTPLGTASDSDTVSFQRKIVPNAAEIHPDASSSNEGAVPTQHQVWMNTAACRRRWLGEMTSFECRLCCQYQQKLTTARCCASLAISFSTG